MPPEPKELFGSAHFASWGNLYVAHRLARDVLQQLVRRMQTHGSNMLAIVVGHHIFEQPCYMGREEAGPFHVGGLDPVQTPPLGPDDPHGPGPRTEQLLSEDGVALNVDGEEPDEATDLKFPYPSHIGLISHFKLLLPALGHVCEALWGKTGYFWTLSAPRANYINISAK